MAKYVCLFVIVLALGTFFGTSESFKQSEQETKLEGKKHSGTWVDESGKLHVIGVVLNESSVRDAELGFRSRSQTAIFMYPEPSEDGETRFRLVLEAYFPSIADHSKVMLTLNVGDEILEQMRQRGTSPRMYPNGVARINIANEDILPVQQLTFKTLKIIPSVTLDADMLKAQFGQASNIINDDDGAHYFYPQIGLDAFFPNEGKASLTFNMPENASKQQPLPKV